MPTVCRECGNAEAVSMGAAADAAAGKAATGRGVAEASAGPAGCGLAEAVETREPLPILDAGDFAAAVGRDAVGKGALDPGATPGTVETARGRSAGGWAAFEGVAERDIAVAVPAAACRVVEGIVEMAAGWGAGF